MNVVNLQIWVVVEYLIDPHPIFYALILRAENRPHPLVRYNAKNVLYAHFGQIFAQITLF